MAPAGEPTPGVRLDSSRCCRAAASSSWEVAALKGAGQWRWVRGLQRWVGGSVARTTQLHAGGEFGKRLGAHASYGRCREAQRSVCEFAGCGIPLPPCNDGALLTCCAAQPACSG